MYMSWKRVMLQLFTIILWSWSKLLCSLCCSYWWSYNQYHYVSLRSMWACEKAKQNRDECYFFLISFCHLLLNHIKHLANFLFGNILKIKAQFLVYDSFIEVVCFWITVMPILDFMSLTNDQRTTNFFHQNKIVV